MANPGRVIATRGLLFVAHVGQPCAARAGVVLNLVAEPDAGAGYRIAPGVPGLHGLNHLLIQA